MADLEPARIAEYVAVPDGGAGQEDAALRGGGATVSPSGLVSIPDPINDFTPEQRAALEAHVSGEYALPDRPNLGVATTRQLLTELVVRMEITQDPRTTAGDWFGGVCAALREALPTKVLDYRTVDDVPPPEPPA